MLKNCQFCKKEYNAWRFKQMYCSKLCSGKVWKLKHKREKRKCLICSKDFEVLENSNKKLCSVDCSNRYFSINFKNEGNPNYGNKHPNMFIHSKEERRKISKAILGHWKTKDRRIKHQKFLRRYKNENGYYPGQSPLANEKRAETFTQKIINDDSWWTNSKRGHYVSIKTGKKEYFQSSYEKDKMVELDNDENVLDWTKKHYITIKYRKYNNYLPDFFITFKNGKKVLEEIKGYINDDQRFIDKSIAALEYCKKNNIEYKITFPNKKNFKNHKHLLEKIYDKN